MFNSISSLTVIFTIHLYSLKLSGIYTYLCSLLWSAKEFLLCFGCFHNQHLLIPSFLTNLTLPSFLPAFSPSFLFLPFLPLPCLVFMRLYFLFLSPIPYHRKHEQYEPARQHKLDGWPSLSEFLCSVFHCFIKMAEFITNTDKVRTTNAGSKIWSSFPLFHTW